MFFQSMINLTGKNAVRILIIITIIIILLLSLFRIVVLHELSSVLIIEVDLSACPYL